MRRLTLPLTRGVGAAHRGGSASERRHPARTKAVSGQPARLDIDHVRDYADLIVRGSTTNAQNSFHLRLCSGSIGGICHNRRFVGICAVDDNDHDAAPPQAPPGLTPWHRKRPGPQCRTIQFDLRRLFRLAHQRCRQSFHTGCTISRPVERRRQVAGPSNLDGSRRNGITCCNTRIG